MTSRFLSSKLVTYNPSLAFSSVDNLFYNRVINKVWCTLKKASHCSSRGMTCYMRTLLWSEQEGRHMYLAQLKNWVSGTALLRVKSFWLGLEEIKKCFNNKHCIRSICCFDNTCKPSYQATIRAAKISKNYNTFVHCGLGITCHTFCCFSLPYAFEKPELKQIFLL